MRKENHDFLNKCNGIGKIIPGIGSLAGFVILALILGMQSLNAQPLRLSPEPGIKTFSYEESTLQTDIPVELAIISSMKDRDTTISQDTLSAPFPKETEVKLLPDRISFMEKFLWGQNGFLRRVHIAAPLTPESRKSELELRRTMLTTHMIGGITTLGLMIAASYFGQKIIDGHRNFRDAHQALVSATIASYSLTGLLAILSPPPLIRRDEESTITIHKTLAWVHFAGMVITPILGNTIGGRRHFNISKAHVHQISAYITTAVFASAIIVITF
ncbi:MAG TPA: hypothetical protein VHO03_16325 [Ignavibacteriales bacterium]|nr:hypothetical protein [Ignavibacteriales bacterium]